MAPTSWTFTLFDYFIHINSIDAICLVCVNSFYILYLFFCCVLFYSIQICVVLSGYEIIDLWPWRVASCKHRLNISSAFHARLFAATRPRHSGNRLFRNCGMPPLADYRPPCVCACVIIRLSSSASQYHTHPSIWAARLSRCLEVCPSLQRC